MPHCSHASPASESRSRRGLDPFPHAGHLSNHSRLTPAVASDASSASPPLAGELDSTTRGFALALTLDLSSSVGLPW